MSQNNADAVIKAFWGESNVKMLKTEISDYLITCPGTDLTFAARSMPASVTDNELNGYKVKVSESIQYMGAPKLPVVIIKVDETTDVAELGIVLYYQYGTATIEREIKFISMDDDNRERVYDELKAADRTIRFLEHGNCKVLKTLHMPIIINDIFYHARLVYLRDLSLNYRMVSHDEMKDSEKFQYNLKGIPETDYPKDRLDEGMLKAVKLKGYDDAYFESKLLLFSADLRDLKLLYNRSSETANFIVSPDVSSCPKLPNGFPLSDFNVDLFIDSTNGFLFKNCYFTIKIALTNVNEYYDFVDGLNTLTPIKKFLGV